MNMIKTNINNLVIRNCNPDDFPMIFELLKQLWPDKKCNWDQLSKVYLAGLESDHQKYICAVTKNNVIAFCSLTIKNNLWQAGNLGHIDELIVDTNYRGLGIGTQLLEAITDIAKQHHCKRIELDTAFHRTKAHNFYSMLDFENRAYLFSKAL